MKRLVHGLTFFNSLIFHSLTSAAQCGYGAVISTNKDYCIGSSLRVSSPHVLEKIVWYQDGVAVDSAGGYLTLSTNGVVVAGGHGQGGNSNQLTPWGVAVDERGAVFVADVDNNRVQKWTPGAGSGVTVAGGNGVGNAADQINLAKAIFVDKQDNLYIYDAGNYRVQRWGAGDTVGTTVVELPDGVGTSGIYVDCQGAVYMADQVDASIVKFLPGSSTPITVAGGNGIGSGPAQMMDPDFFWLDGNGNIFVDDNGNARIQEWKPGAATGITVAGGNGRGSAANQVNVPGVWVDGKDTLYLSDAYGGVSGAVRKWAPGATSGVTILGGNGTGGSSNQFAGNQYIVMDTRGNIFVSDTYNYRVLEFKRTSSIDSVFMPGGPGKYWAVVTDMQGYSQASDTIYINDPQAGPPTISISATATSTPVCTPITFTASTTNGGAAPSLQWEVSGVKAGNGGTTYSNNLFADGDQVDCILTAQNGCSAGLVSDTSNIITLAIDPQGTASVTIGADPDTICKGQPVIFSARVTNGAVQPTFQWLVDGNPVAGDDSAVYRTDSLSAGDIVTCVITSDDVCGLAKSNSIPVDVNTPGVIAPDQVFTIQYGKSLVLEPVVSGSVTSWLWTPGAGLSDSTIENPVADPLATTLYTLKTTTAGCGADSGSILVNVYTPLGLPGAFTPNGDGHNDVYYVLGGPINSRVEDFAVYSRWGQAVFRVHDVAPGDRSAGWNGNVGGKPAPAGVYVYVVVMKYANGSRQVYKGTVVLIR